MRVSVNVLNWKRPTGTLRCVDQLVACTGSETEILVIDNGSDDGTPEAVKERYPAARVLALPENLGFAGGHNRGLELAFSRGADAVLLFNNDAEPTPGFLEPLVRTLTDRPQTGMVSPKIFETQSRETLWYAGGEIDWWRGLAQNRGVGQVDRGAFNTAGSTDFATGCALLIDRATYERVGPMDERYFLYFEDVDWSVRARRAGFDVVYEPASHIFHESGAATGGHSADSFHYYFARNRIRLLGQHGRWYHWATFAPFHLRHTTAHSMRWRRTGRTGRAQAVLRGVADGVRGRVGPYPGTETGGMNLGRIE